MAELWKTVIGKVYEGVISGVTMFGFFVQLDNLVEGLVHVNSLVGIIITNIKILSFF